MNTEKNIFNILNSVTECSTIHDISNKLFLSEPYVSKVIKQAESRYVVLLINRKSKPISLTKAGEIVLQELRQIIEVRNDLEYNLAPFRKQQKFELRVAMNQPWLETNAKGLINYLMEQFPQITFSFHEQTTNVAQQSLLTRSIDIFVGKVLMNQEISSEYLFDSKLYFVIPENCPLFNLDGSELDQNDFQEFADIPFVALTDDSFFQAMVDHLFQDNDVGLNKVVKVANSITAMTLAVEGRGIAIGMNSLANQLASQQNKRIKLLRIPDTLLQLSVGVSHLKSSPEITARVSSAIYKYLKENPFE